MTLFRRLALLIFLSIPLSVFAKTIDAGVKTDITGASTYQFPPQRIDTIVIRFEYKQSALFHLFTLETIDSVVNILLRDTSITLSIDGYAYKDEGNDTICYYLSLNRALFIQTYILGRGVELTRISSIKAYGKTRPKYVNKDKNGLWVNCRAELLLIYPPPPKKPEFFDRDEDGIEDSKDKCPDVFGYKENDGCPDKNAIMVPFAIQESALNSLTYAVLDNVIKVLRENPTYKVSITGHANLAEGSYSMCEKLAEERASMVKKYLLSRQINPSRIVSVKSYGISRPVNPGKNTQEILKNARAEIAIIGKE